MMTPTNFAGLVGWENLQETQLFQPPIRWISQVDFPMKHFWEQIDQSHPIDGVITTWAMALR